jgi:predicted CXXCH cytochrome family protein
MAKARNSSTRLLLLRRWWRAHRPAVVAGTRWRPMLALAAGLGAAGAISTVILLKMSATLPQLESTPEFLQIAGSAAAPHPRPTVEVTFTDGCLSSRCHAPLHAAKTVHATTKAGACHLCHRPDAGGHAYPLVESVQTLCIDCHGRRGDLHAVVQHGALASDAGGDSAGCLTCHNAHASPPAGSLLLVQASVQRTCAGCHPIPDSSNRHPPFASGHCDACHDPHGNQLGGQSLLKGVEASWGSRHEVHPELSFAHAWKTSDHCRSCHQTTVDAMHAATHSHARMEEDCLACHSAHAAESARREANPSPATPPPSPRNGATPTLGALAATPASEPVERCIECHAGIGRLAAHSLVSHDAVLLGRRCISCHAPHAAENAAMLWTDEASVCLECHSTPLLAADGREIPGMASHANEGTHGPVSTGQCSACHSVHGSSHARLLTEVNPRVLATAFDARNYALCFSCHDQNLALVDSEATTQFRQGRTNLHRLHLGAEAHDQRSRGCGSCHAVHASPRPRLIAERVAYDGSEWTMAMNFQLQPDGGSCAPGCHAPAQYSRASERTQKRSSP